MRKRFGSREIGAGVLVVGVALLYWMRPSPPPVTVPAPITSQLERSGDLP
ncbi:MAG: hypothetical protein AAF937_00610 [Planctomycetota bacterium]